MMFNKGKLRNGQRKVFNALVERIKNGERMTGVDLHPRGGKSDIIRMVTLWAVYSGYCCAGVSVSINTLLRNQMGDDDRIKDGEKTRMEEALDRYEVSDLGFPVKWRSYKYWPEPVFANGEVLGSFTIQILTAKAGRDGLMAWVESQVANGTPPIIFFDECQMLGPGQKWESLCQDLYNLGAYVVTLTGTAHRSDGECIPGFNENVVSEREIELSVVEPDPDPDYIQIVDMVGVRKTILMQAHVIVGLEEGWNPDPGERPSLCKISRRGFDFEVSVEEDGRTVYSGKISDCPEKHVRRALSSALRRPQIIAAGVEKLVAELELLRKVNSNLKAIVFTGNDKEGDSDNAHALDVERAIRRLRPQWKCEIATSTSSGNSSVDEDSAIRIAAFNKSDKSVLIVKQSAGVGLDAPSIKVGLDLSTFRQYGINVQRALRVATPFGDHFHSIWITPDDILWRSIWHEAIDANQGVMTRSELEEVDRRRQERTEEPPVNVYVDVGSALPGSIYDSYGNVAEDSDLTGAAAWMIQKFPSLLTTNTYPEIINALRESDSPFPLQSGSVSRSGAPFEAQHTGAQADSLRAEVGATMRRTTNVALEGQGFTREQINEKIYGDQTRFGEYIRNLWTRLKDRAGIDASIELKRVTSHEVLQKLDQEAKRVEREVILDPYYRIT